VTQAVERRGARRATGRPAPFVRHLFLVSLAVAGLFPFYYLFVNSLKGRLAFAQNQLSVPTDVVWSNYARAWDALAKPVFNSIVVVGVSVVLILASLFLKRGIVGAWQAGMGRWRR
jgi:ABC-type glycerol-3-phosphate transport system permease component